MSETESIISFYTEYREIKKNATRQELIDVLGFLDNGLEPSNNNHIYYQLITLEDRYIKVIKELHKSFHHNVPCIKNFLLLDLGYKKNITNLISESEKELE